MNGLSLRSLVGRLHARGRLGNRAVPTRPDGESLLDEATLRQLLRIRLESGRSLTDWLMGEHEGLRRTQSLEFDDYRGYVPGDDFRLIDWHAYARLGELFVKTSLAEEIMSVSLLVDCSRSMDWGVPSKIRYAKQLAAALGALALLHGDRVRVFGLGDGTALPGAPLYGAGALTTLVDDLEQLPVLQRTDLQDSLVAFEQIAEPHGVIVVFSDLLAPMAQVAALGSLALQGRSVVVVHIIAPAEANPALHGTIELQDHETDATSLLSITPAVRDQYRRRFQERVEAIATRLATGNVRFITTSTDVTPADFLTTGLHGEGIISRA